MIGIGAGGDKVVQFERFGFVGIDGIRGWVVAYFTYK